VNLTTDAVIEGLARMVDAVHAAGMLMFQQLLISLVNLERITQAFADLETLEAVGVGV
jgi:2,4-dienoyl-CoA reductase-like NADH-dependent reductase (Old Yellow Enzyme family)